MPAAANSAPSLSTPIADLPGVTKTTAPAFLDLGIRTAADLLRHFPLRHEQWAAEQTIDEAYRSMSEHHGTEASIAVRGEIAASRVVRGRIVRTEATLEDLTGTIRLVWFNAPWVTKSIHPGTTVLVQGKAKRHGDYLEMVNPTATVVTADRAQEKAVERLQAIYPASEALPSRKIEAVVGRNLDALLAQIEDHLTTEYRAARELLPLADAYRMAHRPQSQADILAARRRLAFDELLLLQLGVAMRKHSIQGAARAIALPLTPALDDRILKRLPFALTPAQREAVQEIRTDLARNIPMNRLLQGDVGSGKTAVAVYAMLAAVAHRHQAALMAPTELLAEQHDLSIRAMLAESKVRIALLTGSSSAKDRRRLLAEIASGEIDVVIGTHALLSSDVAFHSLALVVIDEQHRFGVQQRATLRSPVSGIMPHTLVMTATPIPRTLSLTIFGDLDVSTIRELPPGRRPIRTRVVSELKSAEVYRYVADRLREGEQAYIVVPAVEESDAGLKDVATHADRLAKTHLRDLPIATLHGRMDRQERERVMNNFRRGDAAALVATTVIEVGVDVPAATMIVIEHAERFGLAQLHQLRGRIGRGGGTNSKPNLCVLIADPKTPDAEARLGAIESTQDGFQIAERDLEIRGPGELFGARQSGLAPFQNVEFPRDLELLNLARTDAFAWIDRSPELAAPEEKLLRQRLMKAHGKGLGLADVG